MTNFDDVVDEMPLKNPICRLRETLKEYSFHRKPELGRTQQRQVTDLLNNAAACACTISAEVTGCFACDNFLIQFSRTEEFLSQ